MEGETKMKYLIICIFTPTGRTYTFKNVEIICDNESVLQFDYSAMSDGLSKTATFPKNTLCGWSLTHYSASIGTLSSEGFQEKEKE